MVINKKDMKCFRQSGFSLVELVIVVILVSIMGVAVMSRFSDNSGFNTLAARDGIVATALAAQQAALGRNNVTFDINQTGSDWACEDSVPVSIVSSVPTTVNIVPTKNNNAKINMPS